MNELLELAYQRVVALLFLLEIVCVYFLWSLDSVGRLGGEVFALFLALNLVAVAMISYVYRKAKMGEAVSRILLLSGCCTLALFLFAGLFV